MTTWNTVSKPSVSWSAVAKPTRGAAPDGAMVDGSADGAHARPHTDGFFTPDGDWTPVVMGLDTWTAINKPS